ncbi:MAG: thioredoxin family protein [Pirellulales bacterium]
MRIVIGCMLLFLIPVGVVFGIKEYQKQQAHQALEVKAGGAFHARGEVLFFNASWCGPCKQMKPIVTAMRHDGFHMRDVDVDKNRNLAQKYGISSVPTFVFVENGAEVNRFSGGTSADELRRICDSPAYRHQATIGDRQ